MMTKNNEVHSVRGLVIPVTGPVEELLLGSDDGPALAQLQEAVGGWIEAVGMPPVCAGADHATCYINEEGKLEQLPFNGRATDLVVPGIGLAWGDYIAGPMVVLGFDPRTGKNQSIPPGVERRVRLIESEAGR